MIAFLGRAFRGLAPTKVENLTMIEENFGAQLAEVRAQLVAAERGETVADIAQLRDRERNLAERVAAADAAKRAEQARAHREQLAEREREFRARVVATMTEVGQLVPALQLALAETRELMTEAATTAVPLTGVREYQELFGIPLSFPDAVLRAIREAAPATIWDYAIEGAAAPKLATDPGVRVAFPAPYPTVPRGKSGRVEADGSLTIW